MLHTTNSYLITAKTQIMSQTFALSDWFPLLRSLNLLCTPPTPLHSFIDPPIYILQQPNLSFSACFVLLCQPNQLLMNFPLPSSLLFSPFNLSFAHTLHQAASPLSVCICVYPCVCLCTCFLSLYLNQGSGEVEGAWGNPSNSLSAKIRLLLWRLPLSALPHTPEIDQWFYQLDENGKRHVWAVLCGCTCLL